MPSRNVLVPHLVGLLLSRGKNLICPRTEILLSTLYARKPCDCGLAVVLNNLNVCTELSQKRAHDTFRLFEHRAKQMLRLNLLILISLSEFNRGLNRFLSSKCEFI